MPFEELHEAIAGVPAGAWAVGVSGGSDSMALLSLLRARQDLKLHVAHLDHETRGEDSTADAEFVRQWCQTWQLPHTLARRSEIEPAMMDLPANVSAKYRALRLELFRRVVEANGLQGVLLAHHADDQAETILHRLLRGSSEAGLIGMRRESVIGGLTIRRPLLDIHRHQLQAYLGHLHQPWREDASNSSDQYQRNRLRKWLTKQPAVVPALLELSFAMEHLADWQAMNAPKLDAQFPRGQLASLPRVLAEPAGREWLIGHGAPADELSSSTLNRLFQMACDSAQPPRQHFPGNVLVRRHKDLISVIPR